MRARSDIPPRKLAPRRVDPVNIHRSGLIRGSSTENESDEAVAERLYPEAVRTNMISASGARVEKMSGDRVAGEGVASSLAVCVDALRMCGGPLHSYQT